MSDKTSEAEKAFKKWFWHYGGEWNAASVKPVFMAAYEMATKKAQRELSREGV